MAKTARIPDRSMFDNAAKLPKDVVVMGENHDFQVSLVTMKILPIYTIIILV